MQKPVILTIDDEIDVSNAIERDLKSQYGKEYRIIKSNSGIEALKIVNKLKHRNEKVALFLTDQRMPGMQGTEFLEEALKIYPKAQKVLLTAYSDTDTIINSINKIALDYYLIKPWDPPEDKLYPVLTDLLNNWKANNQLHFEGIHVIGHQWNAASHEVKEFLGRNNIPYRWLDIENNEEANQILKSADKTSPGLPYLIFPDGSNLCQPNNREIAERIGLQTTAEKPFYDLVIVGCGPAGLAAAVYGASEGLRTIVIEQEAAGGQAGMSSRIENYLGFPNGISGSDLARRAVTQARRFGVEILTAQKAVGIDATGHSKKIKLDDGNEILSRSLLIATGVSYRKLESPGVTKLTGAGIYYGAAFSEGDSVKGKEIYIVGGANSAGQAAMFFSKYAKTVTILVRNHTLIGFMSKYLIDQIEATPQINVLTKTVVKEAIGDTHLEKLVLATVDEETVVTVSASSLFIFIGALPCTEWIGDQIARSSHGFILSGTDIRKNSNAALASKHHRTPYTLETNLPGVFVAGDVRYGSVKRVASAVGEGSMAVMYIHRYLNSV